MLGITIGDPSGIGPEIVLKALSQIYDVSLRGAKRRSNLMLIGSRELLENLNKKLKTNVDLSNIIYPSSLPPPTSGGGKRWGGLFGRPQKKCGIIAYSALQKAVELLKSGEIKGVVTAPVSKTALTLAGFPFPGQTEFFASVFGVKKYGMLAWSKELKVVLVTIHHPLKEVPKLITIKNVFEKIVLLNDYFIRYEKKEKPKIGVFALNPHAFEFSCGEEEKILKAINRAKQLGINAEGPIPADSIFTNLRIFQSSNLRISYDGYVAMYHDQGMLPVKLISQGSGVNVTLGLPFIRTAPLHGVAFDIAGKGIANPEAMYNAIHLCQKLTEN